MSADAPAAPAPVTENGVPPATQDKVVEEVPGFKVFAGNLAYTTTDEGLKAFFGPVQADIISAQVILRGTRSAGYGFVALKTEAAAQKAAEVLNKAELDGRPVIVEIAKAAEDKEKKPKKTSTKKKASRRAGKAVPGEVTEEEANGEAGAADKTPAADAPAGDEAAKPKKKKKNSRKSKAAKAAAVAENGEAATDAAPADGAAAAEKKPKVKKPKVLKPKRAPGEDPAGTPSTSMLFVASLGFEVDDAKLEALFKDAGVPVTSARVVRRRWGTPRRSKGYGFVDVGTEENQKKAIELLNGKEIDGRAIALKVAVDSQEREAEAEGEAADSATPDAVVVAS